MHSSAKQTILEQLKAVVGPAGYRESAADLEPYLTEWRGLFRGHTPLLLLPASTAQVSEILRICNSASIGVVPQGGNTGLVGGAIPGIAGAGEQILLGSGRLNRVRELDADNYTITVEAGCLLANVQTVALDAGLYFPLSLAAEGSCHIGGNISTNAGGTNVVHYGNTRDLVLGLEVVLPDGRIYDGLRGLRKDNSGYDLKQLFIGAEGTLGFITAATLKLFPAPRSSATAWLAVRDPSAAVSLYSAARAQSGDAMVAFELLPRIALDMVLANIPGSRDPLNEASAWYVLLELAGAREQAALDDALEAFLERQVEAGLVQNGVVASSAAQRKALWGLRHAVSEAQKKAGASIKHDISVPVSRIPQFLAAADAAVSAQVPGIRPVPFGHLGDGNLHYNLSQPEAMGSQEFLDLWPQLNEVVHSLAVSMGGSFSAEHGIGYLKAAELERLASPVKLELMRAVKSALDPQQIMNPGKVLR